MQGTIEWEGDTRKITFLIDKDGKGSMYLLDMKKKILLDVKIRIMNSMMMLEGYFSVTGNKWTRMESLVIEDVSSSPDV